MNSSVLLVHTSRFINSVFEWALDISRKIRVWDLTVGLQTLSSTFTGYGWPSEIVIDLHRLSLTFTGYGWPSEIVIDLHRVSLTFTGCHWPSQLVIDCHRLWLTLRECHWPSEVYVDLQRFPQTTYLVWTFFVWLDRLSLVIMTLFYHILFNGVHEK